MAFSLVVHGIVPKDEICGIVVGHIWYFFNDVYPSLHGGHRPLDPPRWWRRIFDPRAAAGEAQRTDTDNVNRDFAAAAALRSDDLLAFWATFFQRLNIQGKTSVALATHPTQQPPI